MRKFIVSDIHGNGDIYDSIMGYLENVSLEDEVELYINGDLIDRGPDSFRVLMDVIQRIQNPDRIKIHYLGGNHELMMYQALKRRKPGKTFSHWSDWMLNGGWTIEGELDQREDYEELCDTFKSFLGDLKLYHVFDEEILNQPIILVHSQTPKHFIPMKVSDNNYPVFKAVWTRKKDEFGFIHRIGKKGYYTIIGHTPVDNSCGFTYNSKEKYMNIDGGCAGYAIGKFKYDHVPLLELEKDSISIMIFNHNNEITKGFHFDGEIHRMNEEEMNKKRFYLNHQFDGQGKYYRQKILEITNL